jgi:hypothetical protein
MQGGWLLNRGPGRELVGMANANIFFLGVFVTREHVRHNKSGIAHLGRTGINH